MRILVVDDQPANLLLMRRILVPAGFEVKEAASGGEALAVAQESSPNLILLDMHLPDMHGLEVLRRLKESAWGASLTVVSMSALSSPDDQALWLRAGCVGMVEKPITVETFVRTISQWLPAGRAPEEVAPAGSSPHAPRPGSERRAGDAPRDKLGDILVTNRLITPEQLGNAAVVQSRTGKRLGQVLVEEGDLSEDDLAWALSNQLGYPYIYLTRDIIDEEAARLLPKPFLQEHRVLPILKFGQEMTLAMADPTDQPTVDEVAGRTRLAVKRALALASNIEQMIDHFFARPDGPPAPTAATEAQYLQFHLAQALGQGATEIHFDPAADGQARVRYRLQGVLVDRAGQPVELHAAILEHLRDLTGAGPSPATAAATTLMAGQVEVHLAATFLPTTSGPAATVTIYPRRTDVPGLAPLGVPEELIRPLRATLDAGRGVVALGCGERLLRSTLLHALIQPGHRGKAWTLETLAVYRRPTLNQTLVRSPDEVPGLLRRVIDAEADLVAVDDASHREAVVAALEAGRTRMVLAGHSQDDVAGLLSQMIEAAGAPLVASTLRGIMTARPIRLLCPTCKTATEHDRSFVPQGCEACGFTGFRGHRVLSEVWVADPETRSLLRGGELAAAFARIVPAVDRQIREQGLALIEDGLTSLNELARVTDGASWTSQSS